MLWEILASVTRFTRYYERLQDSIGTTISRKLRKNSQITCLFARRSHPPVSRCESRMAAPEAIQVSSLPLPPVQYINLYTDENVRRGRAPRPPPPIHDTYSMFSNMFNADDTIIRPLEAQGIKRLYPQHFDRRRELKKLNHSLLVNFLDLIDLLVQCPDSPRRAEKVGCISNLKKKKLLFLFRYRLWSKSCYKCLEAFDRSIRRKNFTNWPVQKRL